MNKPLILSKGIVKTWHREEGWGSIRVEGLAEEFFAHFSCITQSGNEFRSLVPGEHMMVTWHHAQQDNFSAVADRIEPCSARRVFDTSFDYKTDAPARTNPDADRDSQRLRSDHKLLWTKELSSGVVFAPSISSARTNEYLIFTQADDKRHCYGSDAITNSYTTWTKPQSLVDAIAGLTKEQKARYLDPAYTIGSSMIWPVRSKDQPTMNQARGLRPSIGDRTDLTLKCIQLHYAGETKSPVADVLNAYANFSKLFIDFKGFVDFFHFQDLVTPDYKEVRYFLPFKSFEHSATPATTEEYITYREATLEFIAGRKRRMAEWVTKHHPEIEVLCPWSRPR